MVLVFGGTTEGRRAVEVLEEAATPYYYSTRGHEQEVSLVHGIRLAGGMDEAAMITFCRQHGIRLLVDATHPFAEEVHRNVFSVAGKLAIPLIRYDRIYPPHTGDIVWCDDYDDAIDQLQAHHVTRLVALTGVQTIGRLRRYWQTHECWVRILDRDSSRAIARREGFPEEHLIYTGFPPLGDGSAILTKESGVSGGFCEKVEAAKAAGMKVFVVRRPQYPPCHVVNGPHGLRREVERLLPAFFPLKTGITTGTCATAAAIAALTGQSTVSVRLPNGEDILVETTHVESGKATVVKYSGDDPDITDGMEICAEVMHTSSPSIIIRGGEGVGRVTLPGLGLPIGAAAINEVPQRMIRENLRRYLDLLPPLEGKLREAPHGLIVTISVPKGREMAAQTFNPRIGVVDGISIIGTSGIVRPLSSDAWISSIRKEMSVGMAVNKVECDSMPEIVINSGAKSERFLRQRYPDLPEQAFVHYGNFIGETIQMAEELGVRHLVMGVMIGKAVKLAEGHVNTHSHQVTMNRDFLLQMADEAGVTDDAKGRIQSLNMARELWGILPADEMQRFAHVVIAHCHEHCAPLLPHGHLQIVLISEKGEIYE